MRKRVQFHSDEPSMTQQHLKDQCDVNKILLKHYQTGIITHTNQAQGQSGDFSRFQDFRSNLEMVTNAMNQFNALPSQLRKRFANDPSNLMDFLQDPNNYDEAVKLGLVEKVAETKPSNDELTTNGANPPATPPQA